MTFGEKIRSYRDLHHLTQEQLATRLLTSKQVISRYENNQRSPKLSVAIEYARILGLRSQDFIDDNITTPLENVKNSTADSSSDDLPIGAVAYKPNSRMPVLGRVAAGLPMYAEENIEEYIANDYNDGYEYFALRVKGDSMNAAGIAEDDYVIVRKQEDVDNGTIAIVLVNGDDATVKRFSRNGETVVLTPQSYNHEHQVQIYNTSEVPVRVIGKVVETRHKF